jgi:hypothetical protein
VRVPAHDGQQRDPAPRRKGRLLAAAAGPARDHAASRGRVPGVSARGSVRSRRSVRATLRGCGRSADLDRGQQVLKQAEGPAGHLKRALEFFAGHGVSVQRVMTDNGSPYVSHVHAAACRELSAQAPTHPALPATHQREGRALHPDTAARVGLRAHLSDKRRANRGAAALADQLQLHKTTRRPQPQAARLTSDERT